MQQHLPDVDRVTLDPPERRILDIIEEFRRRQRRRPDLVVRPWWTPPGRAQPDGPPRIGFVLEYCPGGRETVELRLSRAGVVVEGPGGRREATVDLEDGWRLGGMDTGSPEILVNRLFQLADAVLGEPRKEA